MKEIVETLMVLARSSWRFRWAALAVAWALGVLGTLAVLMLPDRFESRAQIYVDTGSVLRPLLQGLAVTPDTQDQADVVRRALLARPSLDRVARKTGLIERADTPAGQEGLITELSDQVTIRGETGPGLYTISYSDASPRMAQAVVQTLLDTFVENALGKGREDTRNAEKFLEQQVADYAARLQHSEQQLAEFKKSNIGLMPDQRGDSFGRLQSEMATLERVQTELAVASRLRNELRRKIAGEVGISPNAVSSPTASEIQTATAIDSRIRESRRALDELLLRFTEKHPDVVALRETIDRLEQQRRTDLPGVRATSASEPSSGAAGSSQGGTLLFDPVIQNLQIGLNTADVQIASLQTQLAQSQQRVDVLRSLVKTGPEIEAELARLNRDYGVTRTQYEALLQRLETARLSNSADKSEDIRFKILESPRMPLKPVKPGRTMLLGAVLVFAGGAGLALAVLLALIQPVVWTRATLQKITGLPVIGVVGLSPTAEQASQGRRDTFICTAVAAALVIVICATAILSQPASKIVRQFIGAEVS